MDTPWGYTTLTERTSSLSSSASYQAHLDLMIILFQAIVHHFFPPLATRTQQHLISVHQLRVISMVYHLL